MRRWVALGLGVAAIVAVAVAWAPVRDALRGYTSTRGSTITRFTLHSRLLHRDLHEVLVTPPAGARGRPLLVLLHGRGSGPASSLSDQLFAELRALGPRAPGLLLVDGGDHSYFHDRADGAWGTYVLREAIPAAVARLRSDPRRVAISGVSMGGFGALDLARLAPHRFCAVEGHSAALWFTGGDTPAGAFDDAEDFARHDVIAAARHGSPYGAPVWIDVGTGDPFRAADTALARELRADGARVTFHVWPGSHGGGYWTRHTASYVQFAVDACR